MGALDIWSAVYQAFHCPTPRKYWDQEIMRLRKQHNSRGVWVSIMPLDNDYVQTMPEIRGALRNILDQKGHLIGARSYAKFTFIWGTIDKQDRDKLRIPDFAKEFVKRYDEEECTGEY